MADIFISYAAEDEALASEVCDLLERHGLACWLANRDIPLGNQWPTEIMRAIETARVMVVIVTKFSANSPHVEREVKTASDRGIPVISIAFDTTPVSQGLRYFLGSAQGLSAVGENRAQALERLLHRTSRELSGPVAPPREIRGTYPPAPPAAPVAQRRRIELSPLTAALILIIGGAITITIGGLVGTWWMTRGGGGSGTAKVDPATSGPSAPSTQPTNIVVPVVSPGTTPEEPVVAPEPPAPAPYRALEKVMRGFTIQIHRTDWIDRYKDSIDETANLGADTVQLMVTMWQDTVKSDTVSRDPARSPTVAQLSALIEHARSRNMRVCLLPVLLLTDPGADGWRGKINPDSWENWFESYGQSIIRLAQVAEKHEVDVFYVGAELVSTENADCRAHWEALIKDVRAVFKGTVAYSANWDHYKTVPFWSKVDLMAVNSYWSIDEASPRAMDKSWDKPRSELVTFSQRINRPVLFSEVGYHSVANAATDPWDYTQAQMDLDFGLQERLYDAFFRNWVGNPRIAGVMLFEFTPDGGGMEDRGYTVQGKPAETVVQTWLNRPWKARE